MDEQINWDDFFDFDDSFLDPSATLPSSSPNRGNNHSPLSVDDIEQLLLNDDDEAPNADALISVQETADGFFHDILLDSPLDVEKSGEVVDLSDGDNSVEEQKNEDLVDHKEEKETSDDDPNDPLAKKRKRQLRNKDAALRSRERKKMYVKELEMKSRYYEGECRRLGSLLQCFMAENQALRFSLHSSKAYNGSTTKQESAVLFLESLLLGSLLWLVGIVCQLILLPSLPPHQRSQGAARLVEEKLPNLEGSKMCRQSLLVGKRFKASRSRMRWSLNSLQVSHAARSLPSSINNHRHLPTIINIVTRRRQPPPTIGQHQQPVATIDFEFEARRRPSSTAPNRHLNRVLELWKTTITTAILKLIVMIRLKKKDQKSNLKVLKVLQRNNGKKRKLTSEAWKTFRILPQQPNEPLMCECKKCGIKYKASSKNGTGNLLRHQFACQKSTTKDIGQYMLSSNKGVLNKLNPTFSQEKFREMLITAMVRHEMPFTFAEYEGFRDLFRYLEPSVTHITRNTAKADILKLCEHEKKRLRAELGRCPSRICLTSDAWTSIVTDGYLSLTAHFVDCNWVLQKRILNFSLMPPPHTGVALAEKISGLIKSWGIEKKLFFITLDNASSNDVCVGLLRNQFRG